MIADAVVNQHYARILMYFTHLFMEQINGKHKYLFVVYLFNPKLGNELNKQKPEQSKFYLRPEASACREAWIAASSYAKGASAIGCVWGGVKNGTLFSACGGNSTPEACQLSNI